MTRHKSRQFNFSLHAKINQIEDNFFDKTHDNVPCVRRLLKEFSNKQGKKRTSNNVLQMVGTIGLTERTAVCHF